MTGDAMNEPAWVSFGGGAARTGPMTWGQRKIRLELREHPEDEYLAFLTTEVPIERHVTMDEVTEALGGLIFRHESLRTRFPADRTQQVLGEGRLPVPAVEAQAGESAADAAGRLRRLLCRRRFDLAEDLPIRAGVVLRSGRPELLLVVLSHMAADGIGTFVVGAELAARLAGRSEGTAGESQPLELAAAQSSDRGNRRSVRALRHWEAFYRRTPAEMLVRAAPAGAPESYCEARLTSGRLAAALGAIARRTGTSRSTVLLAATASRLARHAGTNQCGLVSICANRSDAGMSECVGTLAQDAALIIDTGADVLDELVRRTWSAALRGYAHSAVDPDAQRELRDRIGAERPAAFARDFVYSDMSWEPSAEDRAGDRADAETRVSVVDAEYMWVHGYLTAYRLEGVAELSLWTDERYLPRAEALRFLTGIEEVLWAAAAPVAAGREER